jgi:type III secretion protein Q
LNFRKISGDALPCRNEIFRRREASTFEWLGEAWSIRLSPREEMRNALFCIHAEWGDTKVILRVGQDWIEEVARSVLHDVAVAALPSLVVLALLETIFAEVSNRIEYVTKKRLRLVACGVEQIDHAGMEAFEWRIESRKKSVRGEMLVDSSGLENLSDAMQVIEYENPDDSHWSALPITVRFAVGWVDLPRVALSGLAVHDVLLLDECWLREEEHLVVKVSQTLGFSVKLTDSSIIVTDGIAEIMKDTVEDEFENAATFDDIPVRLTFDLGERTMSLGELKTLAPGFAFDLGRDLRRSVTIRANGKPVGEGELVEISGRIGVSILSMPGLSEMPS